MEGSREMECRAHVTFLHRFGFTVTDAGFKDAMQRDQG
jgi:hypothetical protein